MAGKAIGVFVDIVDQYKKVLKAYKGGKVDYGKYLKKVLAIGDGDIYRAFAYGVQIDNEASGFIVCLKSYGFEPKYKRAILIDDRPNIQETSWNLGITIDIARLVQRLDVVVLGSSDPQLIPAIEYLQEQGIKVIIFSCNIPQELREASNAYYEINEEVLERKVAVEVSA